MEEQRARQEQGKLLAATEDDGAGCDLLSSLPEPLIHHALSLLDLRDIVKASAVCKSWGRICSSFPVLDFRYWEFVGEGTPRAAVQRMVRFVDATMTRFQEQHQKIDKFRIGYDPLGELTDDCLSRIERWISIALDNNTQAIHIALSWWEFRYREMTFPEPQSLDLGALSSSTDGLKSLRSLTLAGFMNGAFLSWGRLMSACGSLESLSITNCCLKEVKISGLPNIKMVSITACRSTRLVEIDAPSLECFILNDGGGYFFVKRTHPCVVNVNHSPNLKSLTLQRVAQNDGWFRGFISRFQRLRDLAVTDCNSLSRIRISNPLIESIKIRFCDNLTDISIEALELRRFRLDTTTGRPLPSIRMENPPCRNPVAEVLASLPPAPGWSSKLREFLVGSCKSFSVQSFLGSNSDDILFQLRNDIKYRWLGVIACNFDQLYSSARRRATGEAMLREFDGADVSGLIWTPHPATVTAVAGLSEDDFLQLFKGAEAGLQELHGQL